MSYVSDCTSRTKEIFVGNYRRFIPLMTKFFAFYKVYRTKEDMQLNDFYSLKYLYSIYHIVPNPLISEFIEEAETSLRKVKNYHTRREFKSVFLIMDSRKRLFQIYMDIELLLESDIVIVTHVRTVFYKKAGNCLNALMTNLKATLYGIHEKTGIKEVLHSNVVSAVIFT